MHVAYRGRGGREPRFYCRNGTEDGQILLIVLAAFRVEKAVVEVVLERLQTIESRPQLKYIK